MGTERVPLTLTRPRLARAAGAGTGIDYLAIVAERHRRQVLHDLRRADPTSAASDLSPWQTIHIPHRRASNHDPERLIPAPFPALPRPSAGEFVLTVTSRQLVPSVRVTLTRKPPP
jgi:hypothetical protein